MNWADWVIVGILLVSCLFGLIRGLMREALSLVIWIIAALCARIFLGSVEPLLVSVIDNPSVRTLSAILIIFISVLILGAFVQYLMGILIKFSGLSFLDRSLGIVFGILRGLVIIMLILIVSPKLTQIQQNPWWQESYLIPFFLQWSDAAVSVYSQVSHWIIQLFGVADQHSI
jgi:membrane protein required for colicin V production